MAKHKNRGQQRQESADKEEAVKTFTAQEVKQMTSAIVGRSTLFSKMGYQYDGDRDVYRALGYPETINFDDYNAKYARHDIAKAVINRPADATWRGDFDVLEASDDEDTALETAWDALYKRLKLKSVFNRADKLSGIGTYGVLFLGFDDARTELDLKKPVQKNASRKLLYVKPLSQDSAAINTKEENNSSDRYGLPTEYNITINMGSGASKTVAVHHTRIVHIIRGQMESEIDGEPELESVYNRLIDLEKLVGASAEMFWRGGRPGYQAEVDPEYQLTAETEATLQDQIDEYEHNLRRILTAQGMKLNPLAMQIADPANHVDIQLQMISAVKGIPKRILTGSELGELASSQDRNNWFDLIETRREEFAEPQIIRPFVDRCIEYGALPAAGEEGYSVSWPDLRSPSDKDKADVGAVRAQALNSYASNAAAESVVPVEAFFSYFLGLDEDAIEHINQQREAALDEEDEDIRAGDADAPLIGPSGKNIEGENEGEEGQAE